MALLSLQSWCDLLPGLKNRTLEWIERSPKQVAAAVWAPFAIGLIRAVPFWAVLGLCFGIWYGFQDFLAAAGDMYLTALSGLADWVSNLVDA